MRSPGLAPRLLVAVGFDDGEHGADVDLLAGLHRQLGDDAGRRGVDLVLHLHRLQPQQRLAALDPIADGDDDAGHGAGHRGEQRAGGDVVGGVGEALDPPQGDRAERRVHVAVGAVRGDGNRRRHAVDVEHDSTGRRLDQRRRRRIRRRPARRGSSR